MSLSVLLAKSLSWVRVEKPSMPGLFFIFTLMCALFPYLSPYPTHSDLQPLAVSFCLFFVCLVEPKRWAKNEFGGGICVLFSLGLIFYFVVSSLILDSFSLRRLGGYLSFMLFSYLGYQNSDKWHKFDMARLGILCMLAWLLGALWQQIRGSHPFEAQLFRISTSLARGVTSLSVEPSTYGLHIILMLIFFSLSIPEKAVWQRRVIEFLGIAQVLLLARSAVSVVALLAYMALLKTPKLGLKSVIRVGVGVLVGGLLMRLCFPESRVVGLAEAMWRDPVDLFIRDQSIYARMGEIFVSFHSLVTDFPLSFGIPLACSECVQEIPAFGPESVFNGLRVGDSLMSGLGTVVFETGIFGLFTLALALGMALRSGRFYLVKVVIVLLVIMFNSMSLATPLFGIILGRLERLSRTRSCSST